MDFGAFDRSQIKHPLTGLDLRKGDLGLAGHNDPLEFRSALIEGTGQGNCSEVKTGPAQPLSAEKFLFPLKLSRLLGNPKILGGCRGCTQHQTYH